MIDNIHEFKELYDDYITSNYSELMKTFHIIQVSNDTAKLKDKVIEFLRTNKDWVAESIEHSDEEIIITLSDGKTILDMSIRNGYISVEKRGKKK